MKRQTIDSSGFAFLLQNTILTICKEGKDMFYCLIVGSRYFTDYPYFAGEMDHLLQNQEKVTIVSGGAKGTDTMAKLYAEERGYPYREFPADWSQGRSAGYRRNWQMHEYISQFPQRGCVAFWNGDPDSGTAHSFRLAKEFCNPLKIVNINAHS